MEIGTEGAPNETGRVVETSPRRWAMRPRSAQVLMRALLFTLKVMTLPSLTIA